MPLPRPRWRFDSFSSLRHRNYRLLWLGNLVSNTGDWMDQIALNWLVITIRGNPFDLALLNLFRATPILAFTLLGGAVADRMDRRRMLMMTQSIHMLTAFLLAFMVLGGHAPLWAVLAIAAVRGINIAFNLPARHSLVPLLVPPEAVPNAVALNSMTINLTKVIGPAFAGVLIAGFGTGICFLLNALSFLVVLWTLALLRFDLLPARERARIPLHRSIAEGLRHTAGDRVLLLLVLLSLVPTFFGQPYLALLSLFAHDVYDIGADGLGVLTAVASVGSITGAFLLASMPRWAASTRVMVIFLMLLGLSLAAFALTPAFAPALPLLFCVGAMNIACNAANNTQIQLRAPDHMRGRVMSIMLMNRGVAQIGVAAWAALAGFVGVQAALASSGAVIAVIGVVFLLFSRLGQAEPVTRES